ncbi:MAG: fimbrillin family protein [Muribaculaceae bacterium]|nr:fimbrillin family protein [Muribaculaceae bacterium]
MKKSLFMLCVAAATLASCSQEDVLDMAANHGADNAINFRARTFKATRGAEVTSESLNSFMVIGLKGDLDAVREGEGQLSAWWTSPVEFKRSTVEGDANGDMQYFRSDTPMYFPSDFSPVSFLAYAPSTLSNVSASLGQPNAEDNGNLLIEGYTVNSDINSQEDIIIDGVGGVQRDDTYPSLDLYFKHALSKVFVSKAKNDNSEYTYKVAGVRFGNIAMTGDCKYDPSAGDGSMHSYFTWTYADQKASVEHKFAKGIEIDGSADLMSGAETDGSFLLIPQTLPSELASEESDQRFLCKEGVAYIGLLIQIVQKDDNKVVYPFEKGVDNITETIDGEKYAWAIFPVGTTWLAGNYVDYQVDFTNGAGFVAPGAEGYDYEGWEDGDEESKTLHFDLQYKPIFGESIKFTVEICGWDKSYTDSNVQQNGDKESLEVILDGGAVEDPFGE